MTEFNDRVREAKRPRPIFGDALINLDNFLQTVQNCYTRKPVLVDHAGHEAVRYVNPVPEDAILLKIARLVSLNAALLVLVDLGFVQEQGIIQRSIEETNEDILYISICIVESKNLDKLEAFLVEFWKEDWTDPAKPVETRVRRGFTRKGITSFLNRVFDQSDPSSADENANTIFSMYSGFTHGASPHIMELYDFDGHRFLTKGLCGTNRHLDYIFDSTNSIYRSMMSMGAAAKAFGSVELVEIANKMMEDFVASVGKGHLIKDQ